MKQKIVLLKEYVALVLFLFCLVLNFRGNAGVEKDQEYYQLKIYHVTNPTQKQQLETFLEKAYLPALHRAGIEKVGVFYPAPPQGADSLLSNDSLVYVLIPFSSLSHFSEIDKVLAQDKKYKSDGKAYFEAAFDKPPYARYASILMHAFSGMPALEVPAINSDKSSAVYELRSYEAATELLHLNKVRMFNEGEIALFEKLGFNAVFYARVIAGDKLPNLMYMTSFDNMKSREQHWSAFVEDQRWKDLSSDPQYKNNFLKADVYLLHATPYSDI